MSSIPCPFRQNANLYILFPEKLETFTLAQWPYHQQHEVTTQSPSEIEEKCGTVWPTSHIRPTPFLLRTKEQALQLNCLVWLAPFAIATGGIMIVKQEKSMQLSSARAALSTKWHWSCLEGLLTDQPLGHPLEFSD